MAELVEISDVRRIGNFPDSTVLPDEKLTEHRDLAYRLAKKALGTSLYGSIADGSSEFGEDGKADLKIAVALLAVWSALPTLNMATQGKGVMMSESKSAGGGMSGTTRFMMPSELDALRSAIKEQAMSLLDDFLPGQGANIVKVECKQE